MVTFSYRTQSKNPNIASEYEGEVSILIDTLLYRYFPSLRKTEESLDVEVAGENDACCTFQ